jgi:hypothetical protein
MPFDRNGQPEFVECNGYSSCNASASFAGGINFNGFSVQKWVGWADSAVGWADSAKVTTVLRLQLRFGRLF